MAETTRKVCEGCDNNKCRWCGVADPYPEFVCIIDKYGYGNCPNNKCHGVVFQCVNKDNYQEEFKSCYICKYIPVNFSVIENTE